MCKSDSSRIRIPFCQKLILVIFGLFLFFVLLEVGLRLGGFILSFVQERRNIVSLQRKGTYRIMCLGESTTAFGGNYSYPNQLEEIINKLNIGIKFSVINKGIPGIDTSKILNQAETDLDKYAPDIVIAMMGLNDSGAILPYEAVPISEIMLFLSSFRTYKLISLVWFGIIRKINEVSINIRMYDKRFTKELPFNISKHIRQERYANDMNILQIEKSLRRAIELNPRNDNAYVALGWLYCDQGKFSQAEELLKRAIELNPRNDNAYVALGWFYINQGRLVQPDKSSQESIKPNCKDDHCFKWPYLDEVKLAKAKESLRRAIELNPRNDNAYVALGWFYRLFCHDQGRFSQKLFRKAIELNPRNDNAYVALGWLYCDQGKFSQAEELLKRAIELNPEDAWAYRVLIMLYRVTGKYESADEYYKKANKFRLNYYNLKTLHNYHRLKEILDKRKITFVCVQYPMRSIEPLKKIFDGQEEGIIFVDNEKVFKEALKRASYDEYFADMFAGDFGHCTAKGNRLLAENIAKVILKECFNK